jgi:hypothetical protein
MDLAQYQAALQQQSQDYSQWQTGQTTAQQIFAANQQNLYNKLYGMTSIGENASGGSAQNTATMSANMAQTGQQAGQQQAAGMMNATNSLTGALGNLTQPVYNPQTGQISSPLATIGNSLFGSGNAGNLSSYNMTATPNSPIQFGGSSPTQMYAAGAAGGDLTAY